MFVELHILQNFPPSNLNRDDVGQPKETDFGGVRRARISSQCLKRNIRYAGKDLSDDASKSIFEQYTGVPLSKRSQRIVDRLSKRLAQKGKPVEEAGRAAMEFARVYSSKKGKMNEKRPEETTVLLYLSEAEVDDISDQLIAMDWAELLAAMDSSAAKATKGKKKDEALDGAEEAAIAKSPLKKLADQWARETSNRPSAPDIALFGRMLADRPETNIDAACQVAHAISTHAVPKAEIDYYTAMDELKPRNDPGAAFLDVAYFTSACFYRYARIDVGQLTRNLGGDAELAGKSVEAFIRASEAMIPGGKKNSHAQETRPGFMLAVVRADNSQGWSLVNAFEMPIRARNEANLTMASVAELCAEFDDHISLYSPKTVLAKSVFASRQARSAITGNLQNAVAKSTEDASALDVLVNTITGALSQGA